MTPFAVVGDSSAPTTVIECDGGPCAADPAYPGPVTITLQASDSGSGVDRVRYTTHADGGYAAARAGTARTGRPTPAPSR